MTPQPHALACSCSSCSMCNGRGSYSVDSRGRFVPHGDDLYDLETCEECGGSGMSYECDYCLDQREQDGDYDL